MIMSDSIQVKVGSLGVVEGKICADGVECFLGIPYAVLNKRWGRAAPISSFANERHDGTHYGFESSPARQSLMKCHC